MGQAKARQQAAVSALSKKGRRFFELFQKISRRYSVWEMLEFIKRRKL
jgi:hypothetical protein